MIRYIEMTQAHVPQVAELEKFCFSSPWSENAIKSELSNPLSLWVVAIDDNTLVGYVGSQTVIGESDMMNLAVSSNYRRMGIGENLVKELIHRLKLKGSNSLTLEVRQSNQNAISLYQKLGFVQVGCRPNYYSNPKEAALLLRKEWKE